MTARGSGLARIGWLFAGAYALVLATAAWQVGATEVEVEEGFRQRDAAWAGSDDCRSCHPDHHASWYRTFHRTMTQEATPESVLGAFDGEVVTFWGVPARPVRRDGRYLIEYLDRDERTVLRTLEVERTVGSRRYQQYLVQDPDDPGERYYRIPLLWHVEEARWIHLNGAFLGPDDPNYDKHIALWNENCIFCHNTGPNPGLENYEEVAQALRRGEDVDVSRNGLFRSSVAELGIGCESCHGPAGEHVERNRDPLRRYALHLGAGEDPTIVDPLALDRVRSVEVCGQCHGQRMPRTDPEILDWMHDGPTYRAGERLADTIRPIQRDTPPPVTAAPDQFEQRFWADGTPRLTAYEYQGVLASPCYREGTMTCLSCHDMHGGREVDVRGQVRPEMRTNAACTACHAEIAADVSAHTHHAPDSSGSSCYECHMPRAVYGVLSIHRSHRIENPDPTRDAEAGRPNACTSCHVDKSAPWAAAAVEEWWGGGRGLPRERGDGAPLEVPGLLAALHAGDPVQRAVAGELAGRDDTPLAPRERAFLVPHLILTLFDGYPTVRWFARRSLRRLEGELARDGLELGLADDLEAFDYLAPREEREALAKRILATWNERGPGSTRLPAPPAGSLLDARYDLDMPAILRLLEQQSTKVIEIGE